MSALSYPLSTPLVQDDSITVDMMLNEPTRITRYLSDLTLKNWFADKIFPPSGSVEGGALVYDQLTTNDLYSGRDVAQVAPGAEFPLVTNERAEPRVKPVEKYGGKFFVTDEARRRNDSSLLRNGSVSLSNTIFRKSHQLALAELDALYAELGADAQTLVGADWSAVVTAGTNATSNTGWPTADFARAQLIADKKELGVVFDTWIVNPQEFANFQIAYSDDWRAVATGWGVEIVRSNLVPAGTAWVVASGQVGEQRLEVPLTTETWREPDGQKTWVQSSVSPLFAVTNPFSVLKVTGLAG